MGKFSKQEKLLKRFSKTDFENDLLKAAFLNLQDSSNKLRFNNFAYSVRELSRHILKRLAPDGCVLNSPWYKSEIPNIKNGITRAQRIKFAVQGGLTDKFVLNRLELDLTKSTRRLLLIIDQLSKFTHVDKSTFGISPTKIRAFVKETAGAFDEFFVLINKCKSRIINEVQSKIDSTVIAHIFETTFDEIDILSTQSTIENVYIDKMVVDDINDKEIEITITGSVSTRLQYGSNSDVRNGDGYVARDHFFYSGELHGKVNQLEQFEPEIESIRIDTKKFYF